MDPSSWPCVTAHPEAVRTSGRPRKCLQQHDERACACVCVCACVHPASRRTIWGEGRRVCACVHVCVCARARPASRRTTWGEGRRVCARVHVCVCYVCAMCACVCVCVCVSALGFSLHACERPCVDARVRSHMCACVCVGVCIVCGWRSWCCVDGKHVRAWCSADEQLTSCLVMI